VAVLEIKIKILNWVTTVSKFNFTTTTSYYQMGNMVGSFFFFYSKYFEEIKNFVSNLPDNAVSIKECKKVLAKEDLHNQLQFIQTS
jgi:hypothetical protein